MKLIIFDIDGTLCHSKYIDDKCYVNAFRKALDIDISDTNWNNYKHVTDHFITLDIIKNSTGIKAEFTTVEKVIDYYYNELKEAILKEENCFKEIPGAVEFVRYLTKNGNEYISAAATGGFFKTASMKLELLGFPIKHEQIYTSDNYLSKTEMLKGIRSACDAKQLSVEKYYYFGDRIYDFESANEAGYEFIGIDFDHNNRLVNEGIKKVINDYLPIEKVLGFI